MAWIAGSSAATRDGQERRGDEPAQPGVIGRVDVQHVAGEGGAGQALGDDLGVVGQGGEHVLGDAGGR